MTPTLAMIVQREAEIDGFKLEPIYRLSISRGGITALSDRFEKKTGMQRISECAERTAIDKIDPQISREKATALQPTALQRDAASGITAQQTLRLYTELMRRYCNLSENRQSFSHGRYGNINSDLAGKMVANLDIPENGGSSETGNQSAFFYIQILAYHLSRCDQGIVFSYLP